MKKIISVIAMMVVLTISITYMYGVLSENNEQINVEGTAYEDGYDSNVKVQVATSHILAPIGSIFAVLCLIIGFKKLKKQIS